MLTMCLHARAHTSYYTPCYLAISATSLLLKAMPAKVPKAVNSGLGCVLTAVASIWSLFLCAVTCAILPLLHVHALSLAVPSRMPFDIFIAQHKPPDACM